MPVRYLHIVLFLLSQFVCWLLLVIPQYMPRHSSSIFKSHYTPHQKDQSVLENIFHYCINHIDNNHNFNDKFNI